MVLFYLIIVVIIFGMNISKVFEILLMIILNVFDFLVVVGGMFGSIVFKIMLMGIKCGLFLNEVGMGFVLNLVVIFDVKYFVS